VKQLRHLKSAGRGFNVCQLKRHPPTLDAYLKGCNFYRWIDGHEMFDLLIRLFPYNPWKSWPYPEFVCWLLPPPNPPDMTKEEKIGASLYHLANPPRCHCGVSTILTYPSQHGAFTLPSTGVDCHGHAINLFQSFYVFYTYNITLGTFSFCSEGSHLVTLRSTIMDPNRTGLLSMN